MSWPTRRTLIGRCFGRAPKRRNWKRSLGTKLPLEFDIIKDPKNDRFSTRTWPLNKTNKKGFDSSFDAPYNRPVAAGICTRQATTTNSQEGVIASRIISTRGAWLRLHS